MVGDIGQRPGLDDEGAAEHDQQHRPDSGRYYVEPVSAPLIRSHHPDPGHDDHQPQAQLGEQHRPHAGLDRGPVSVNGMMQTWARDVGGPGG